MFQWIIVVVSFNLIVPVVVSVCEKTPILPNVPIRSVCYAHVGCFNDSYPFNNAHGKLPLKPEYIQTEFRLFTPENSKEPILLDYGALDFVTGSTFNPARPTKFVIHGFFNSANLWVAGMKDALLTKDNLNVVTINWEKGAAPPDYNQAVANVRLVAVQTYLVIRQMVRAGADLQDVHLIGHSLGAHMAGTIGKLMGDKIGRISGLDPADPDYQCLPKIIRLDETDAIFVDVIHTNGAPFSEGGAGLIQQSGDIDFYVNGGKTQPGCPDGLGGAFSVLFSKGVVAAGDAVSCSHARSHDLYTESILSDCAFKAFPCLSHEDYLSGRCMMCGPGSCGIMGYHADQSKARGSMFLQTRGKQPFCGHQYFVNLTVSTISKPTRGTLYASLQGQEGKTAFAQITPKDSHIASGETIMAVGVFSDFVGQLSSVTLRYDKYGGVGFGTILFGGGRNSLSIDSVRILAGDSGHRYDACDGQYVLNHKEEVLVAQSQPASC
ncbi:pancreatic lipase-related protein 2 [Plakobranchus ocellatus]|uniref:Pancreatic lipase-related protein 2 n=1 Tax=Plakobranchus ocellatus TaxID=259542 RepID=A0AAV3XUX1_9GAST|nr:pancreatic lipase-related protein 2 [Plakobranchus ocellatus]